MKRNIYEISTHVIARSVFGITHDLMSNILSSYWRFYPVDSVSF